jgi:hypothetical protein
LLGEIETVGHGGEGTGKAEEPKSGKEPQGAAVAKRAMIRARLRPPVSAGIARPRRTTMPACCLFSLLLFLSSR